MTSKMRALLGATAALTLTTAFPAVAQRSPAPGDDLRTRNPAEPLVSSYPAPAAGEGTTTAGFNLSRWAEDWRLMRDPKLRDDILDRLKYIPLDRAGDVYLTLSGELRLRVNETSNPNLREGSRQRQDINRIVGGADLHIGEHFRAFGEIAHGGISGPNIGTPAATLRNDAVVQQAFVEGETKLGSTDIGARYGRQEFTDGSNLLTSQRDNNTIRFVLNGVRAWARGKTVRADIFDFRLTQYGAEGFGDDRIDHGRRFSGVTAGLVIPKDAFGGSKLYLDPFVWRLRSRRAAWGTTNEREERVYYGARLWGDAGPVTVDWTVNHQGGSYGGRNLSAWQALMAQTVRVGAAKTAPRIGFHADYASGGGSYGRGTLHAAFAPFGNNIYYSYQLFLTPTNLIAVAPNFTFNPVKAVRASLEYQWAWRDSLHDAVYRANGTAFAGTERTDARKIAESLRAQLVWTVTSRISITGRYEHLNAGPALTRAGYASSDFLAGWVSFRF